MHIQETEAERISVDALTQIQALAKESYGCSNEDLGQAKVLQPYWADAQANVYILPKKMLAPCCAKCLHAMLAHLHPDLAHAVLKKNGRSYFEASIQGSARARSGGRIWLIHALPVAEIDHFIQAFSACHWGILRSPVFRPWQ